jgi:hypothetical protein
VKKHQAAAVVLALAAALGISGCTSPSRHPSTDAAATASPSRQVPAPVYGVPVTAPTPGGTLIPAPATSTTPAVANSSAAPATPTPTPTPSPTKQPRPAAPRRTHHASGTTQHSRPRPHHHPSTTARRPKPQHGTGAHGGSGWVCDTSAGYGGLPGQLLDACHGIYG